MTTNPRGPLPVVKTVAELRAKVAELRRAGRSIGLVPTMGALHAGHTSLVDASRQRCGATIVTIFVNPLQFGPSEDFARYPRTLSADLEKLAAAGADLVFAPEPGEVYAANHATYVNVEGISQVLEGRSRPIHFRGVATVVLKLFNMVTPDVAFFGQKDYQQTLVIRRMTADLDLPIEIVVRATVREPDGLAMSSRNAYLSADERRRALALSQALERGAQVVAGGERDVAAVERAMRGVIDRAGGVEIDYLLLADRETLAPAQDPRGAVMALVAARVGATRLIDNRVIEFRNTPAMEAEG